MTSQVTRRRFLSGAAAVGSAAVALPITRSNGTGTQAAASTGSVKSAPNPVTVRPGDIRYGDLVRGYNQRWVGTPEHVTLVWTTQQVVQLVQDAVSAGKRIAVRSGGHCYEDFVTSSDIRVVIDMSEMKRVYFDSSQNAFAVEPGAMLGEVYEALFKGWGVTIPGGSCPTVGAGGHIVGGGYGQLNRSHGLTVDYLYGVEVVVVDSSGTARSVVATRDSSDPALRGLWWAHTGAGGGNFGVITRYWLRDPNATDTNPANLLPKPPAQVWVSSVSWPWDSLTEQAFTRLLRNFGAWHEANSAPNSPYTGLFSRFNVAHRANGAITLVTQLDASTPNAEQMLNEYLAAINDGVGVIPRINEQRRLPWLHSTLWSSLFGGDPTGRADFKSAYMRRNFTDAQLAAFYQHLTRTDYQHPVAMVQIASYGGKTNTVSPSATAVAQRDSVMKLHYLVAWTDPAEDSKHISWLREFYRDVYSDTGGVPVPNAVTDGCFINYADLDLSDPQWNTSGVPWHTLYYKDNYPRLQQVKATWDPRDIFRHAQSIQLPNR
ncbi:FAD-linked oxidase [Carbonactinospora thermoautotrophica]|uniref:FAD-binding oxidoreductase n=1 Tax=Carbonactinospora thermoautotrophica TaxID=1469144 RepID=UPI00226D4F3B|nr:FAD-binding oxidoreductase [Carbonactinospora thermoautotrophica]MCX9192914.1 FAD-linked oxidase [Carbonactinospora thermoautotrophica]